MSEMKDEEEVSAGHDSSDTSDDEELIDAETEEHEESGNSEEEEDEEEQSPGGNPVSPGEDHLSDDQEEASAEHPTEVANADDVEKSKSDDGGEESRPPVNDSGAAALNEEIYETKVEEGNAEEFKNGVNGEEMLLDPKENGMEVEGEALLKEEVPVSDYQVKGEVSNQSFPANSQIAEGEESGSEEDQATFMKELETFFRDNSLEFKPPKFYGEGLNCLKLWRAVTRLGGYDQVTSCKLWRQVGESFKPPKTCTTVSWSFRCFYEKALLEYERHKMRGGELHIPVASVPDPIAEHQKNVVRLLSRRMVHELHIRDPGSLDAVPQKKQTNFGVPGSQASGSGRARRDAAARAMQGWHSQRLLGNGEVGDPIIKDKSSMSTPKRDKHLKSAGLPKRKKPSSMDRAVKAARTMTKPVKPQLDTMVSDIGPPADWVKINVRKTKDCFEVYALVPGLLREEVRVQSDPAGRLVISGDPEQPDNPWGVTPFKKVITLPSRIDPHQTSAVVTLHGQLFVRVPFEPSDL